MEITIWRREIEVNKLTARVFQTMICTLRREIEGGSPHEEVTSKDKSQSHCRYPLLLGVGKNAKALKWE